MNQIECHIPYQDGPLPIDAISVWWSFQGAAGSPHVPDYFELSIPLSGIKDHGQEAQIQHGDRP